MSKELGMSKEQSVIKLKPVHSFYKDPEGRNVCGSCGSYYEIDPKTREALEESFIELNQKIEVLEKTLEDREKAYRDLQKKDRKMVKAILFFVDELRKSLEVFNE